MSKGPINSTVAVIGAGNMGSGIAQKYATHGYQVVLVDQNNQRLRQSQNSIVELLKQGVFKGVFLETDAKGIMDRIHLTENLGDCQKATLIVEAIFEDLPLKRELFLELEELCPKEALIASNTSSFKIKDLQSGLKFPERVLGLHYFYHPAKNRLVEIIGSDLTAPSALGQAKKIQESLNKIIIQAKDSPGFVVNRFFVPWLNEAMRIVEDGSANVATVDFVAKDFFRIAMGPFQLMNLTGLPITFHSCHSLKKAFGDFYEPCPAISRLIEQGDMWKLTGPIDQNLYQPIAMRLLAVVCAISCQMVYEERICTIADVDLGARIGLLWQKGPFELLNANLNLLSCEIKKNIKIPHSIMPTIFKTHLASQEPL
ncbi:MAG TPA: 3-hydroxyacyl-CoA dehydrogenase family protein [Myxococcota bacterium]|nr:3-hydroxyacyl-CoA dehydrogenase family protein [Myxococcota bacterium]